MLLRNKRAIIFDLDGTLADTIGAIAEAVNMALAKFSYPTRSEEEVRFAVGNGARMIVKRLMPEPDSLNDDKVTEVLECYDKMYALTYLHTTEMYDGIEETVRRLHDNGIKLAVFSNKQDAYVKGLVEQFFSTGMISVARGQTDIPIKPDPAGTRIVLEELGASADECVFVGDSGVDLKTAEKSGMDFIGVSWGFWGKERLSDAGAGIIVDRPCEMLNYLKLN